jgi:hypothetical protein
MHRSFAALRMTTSSLRAAMSRVFPDTWNDVGIIARNPATIDQRPTTAFIRAKRRTYATALSQRLCHPERSEEPMQAPLSPLCHPERSEGPMQPLYPSAFVILSEAKDPCNRLCRHRSVILSEAKDLCNRLCHHRSVILSEAKDLCNRLCRHRSGILSEAKDLCNRLSRHRSIILSEAKDLCNRSIPAPLSS